MPQDIAQNNKRIAKNTIALYFRTFITMIVGLYTGRVMLHALGVDNYGINAVIGGIVSMTSLLTGTMSNAISRYITYSLGQENRKLLKTVFSTAVNAEIVMAIFVALILEIAGVWFLNSGAQIPEGRMVAANWVLQCSIVSLFISLISSPFNATIIAHERMSVYAYTSIVDAILRLAICFAIMTYGGDRLIFLAILQIGVALLMQSFYGWFCKKHFEEATYSPMILDKRLLKDLTVFSGWNLLNNGAWTFSTQGVNMLVNHFFGVVFNASRAVAVTVNTAIQSFVGNFTTAFSPQITKSYAVGNIDYSISLVNKGTKFTWLMMYVFIVPVCMEADTLLKLWLGMVPPMAALFLQLSMFESLAVASGSNMLKLIQADGNIKRYTIDTALYAGLVFPLSWIAFAFGAPVWSAYVIFILVFFSLNIIRFVNLKRLMPFSIRQHVRECLRPCAIVSVTSFVVPIMVSHSMKPGIARFFVNGTISVLWTVLCCILFGLTKNERTFFQEKVCFVLKKVVRK